MAVRIMYTRDSPRAGEGMSVSGYATLFNSPTELWPRRWEVIRPGAFRSSLAAGADVRALFNHDRNMVLGRVSNGTLRLVEDDKGLRYDVDLNPDDPEHVSVFAKIKRQDVSQSSFCFDVPDGGENMVNSFDRNLGDLYEIVEAGLIDVSPVTFPAYIDTTVAARGGFYGPWAVSELEREEREKARPGNGDSGPIGASHSGDGADHDPACHAAHRLREMELRIRGAMI